ncbi:hypothetical protein CIK05_00375 [Bdellovibrio sp. qaytius]|nr:hypothetical protein CIK05_00375 [Bdellovibrio sp. qaytius]
MGFLKPSVITQPSTFNFLTKENKMKVLLASAVLVLSTIASATTFDISKGINGVTLLNQDNVNLISVETSLPNCPAGAVCDPASVLTIKFTLNGCMSKLGPVTIEYAGQTPEGKQQYVVTAFELKNEKSLSVMCIRAPIGTATKVIGRGFMSVDNVEVKFANSLAYVTTL